MGAAVVVCTWISVMKTVPSDVVVTVAAGRVVVWVMNSVLLIVAVNVTRRYVSKCLLNRILGYDLPGTGVSVVVVILVKNRVLFCVTVSGAKVLVIKIVLSTVSVNGARVCVRVMKSVLLIVWVVVIGRGVTKTAKMRVLASQDFGNLKWKRRRWCISCPTSSLENKRFPVGSP